MDAVTMECTRLSDDGNLGVELSGVVFNDVEAGSGWTYSLVTCYIVLCGWPPDADDHFFIGSTYEKLTVPGPDHVSVMVDNQGYPTLCPSTGIYVRQMQMQLVDSSNNPVTWAPSIQEQYQGLSANSCGNGNPIPTSCGVTSGGTFIDTLAVSGNVCGSNIPQQSGCGFSLTSQWSMCSSGLSNTIWTSPRSTLSNSVSVNGQTSQFSTGTQLH